MYEIETEQFSEFFKYRSHLSPSMTAKIYFDHPWMEILFIQRAGENKLQGSGRLCLVL